jgi:type VI secretion system protein ImpA
VQWNELQSKAEGEKRGGITQPPRWADVQEEAMEMAGRWKHLRLGVILLECAVELEGLSGLRDGLTVLNGWCANYWDKLHPCGDEADIRDLRPPLIDALQGRPFIFRLEQIPVAKSLGGTFGFGDYENAKNAPQDDEDAQNHARLVKGTFESTPAEVHQANLAVAKEALELTRSLEECFDNHLGMGHVDLLNLRDFLSGLIRVIEPLANPSAATSSGDEWQEAGTAVAGAGPAMVPGAINSRQAAIAALDSVIRYFERTEPSSPVPYLLRRAQRCVGKSFMELVEELANDRAQAELILKPQEAQPVQE